VVKFSKTNPNFY